MSFPVPSFERLVTSRMFIQGSPQTEVAKGMSNSVIFCVNANELAHLYIFSSASCVISIFDEVSDVWK